MIEPVVRPSRPGYAKAAPKSTTPEPDDAAGEEAVAKQHADFDFAMAERAELLREADVRRDMMLQQLKADEEVLKKYIAMI